MAAIIPALISAAGSIGGGYLASRNAGSESKIQKTGRHTVDDILASIRGNGPYSNLFNFDQNAFNTSFVNPAKQMFANQIAPAIQQQFIASGQQRGSGLDSQLTRAGVDLDSMLNQYLYQFQNQGKQNALQSLGNISQFASGGTQGYSPSQSFGSAAGGYLQSTQFPELINNLMSLFNKSPNSSNIPAPAASGGAYGAGGRVGYSS